MGNKFGCREWKSHALRVAICAVAIDAVVLAGLPTAAAAGTKVIWPSKLVPAGPGQPSIQSPNGAASKVPPSIPSSGVTFYYKLRLPAGSRIRDLNYYHKGTGPSAFTDVFLARYKFGKDYAVIAGGGKSDGSNAFILVDGSINPAADTRVLPQFEYVVVAFSANNQSIVGPIKVRYR